MQNLFPKGEFGSQNVYHHYLEELKKAKEKNDVLIRKKKQEMDE